MKFKNIILYLSVFVFAITQLTAQTNPVVSNVAFSISGTTVTVTYDVSDAEVGSFTIYMDVSDDGGTTWDYNYGATSGDIGAGISSGVSKSIQWTYSGAENGNMKIRISADDLYGDQIYYGRQIYNTVTIGTQIWLKENLNVGTMINSSTVQSDNSILEKYCYENDAANCLGDYGGLYQWNELMQYTSGAEAQGICPTGWHIPTQAEFFALDDELKDIQSDANLRGKVLKAVVAGGTNESGFTALYSGYYDGAWKKFGTGEINMYTSTGLNEEVYFNNYTFNTWTTGNNAATAVRCIKD